MGHYTIAGLGEKVYYKVMSAVKTLFGLVDENGNLIENIIKTAEIMAAGSLTFAVPEGLISDITSENSLKNEVFFGKIKEAVKTTILMQIEGLNTGLIEGLATRITGVLSMIEGEKNAVEKEKKEARAQEITLTEKDLKAASRMGNIEAHELYNKTHYFSLVLGAINNPLSPILKLLKTGWLHYKWKKMLDKFIKHPIDQFNYEKYMLSEHWEETKNILQGKNDFFLTEVELSPSAICNFNCPHCIGKNELLVKPAENKEMIISADNTEILLNRIVEINNGILDWDRNLNMRLSGLTGEPLMAEDSVMRALELKNALSTYNENPVHIRIGLNTNGFLLDDAIMEVLVKHCNFVHVAYPLLKDKETENIVMRNVCKLVELRNKTEGTKLEINVDYILTKESFAGILNAALILKRIGVDRLRIRPDDYPQRGRELNVQELKVIKKEFKEIRKLANDNFSIEFPQTDEEIMCGIPAPDFEHCWFSKSFSGINQLGEIAMCQFKIFDNGNRANLLKDDLKTLLENREESFKALNPSLDCQVCTPMALRVNRLMEWMYKQNQANSQFLSWVETKYANRFLKVSEGVPKFDIEDAFKEFEERSSRSFF